MILTILFFFFLAVTQECLRNRPEIGNGYVGSAPPSAPIKVESWSSALGDRLDKSPMISAPSTEDPVDCGTGKFGGNRSPEDSGTDAGLLVP